MAAFESRLTDSTLAGLGEVVAYRIADGLLRSGVAEVVDPVTALYAVRDVRAEDTPPPRPTRHESAHSPRPVPPRR